MDPIEVTDKNAKQIAEQLKGRTIVAFKREPNSGERFPMGENDTTIVLDDGTEMKFSSWGYDAWGLEIYIER